MSWQRPDAEFEEAMSSQTEASHRRPSRASTGILGLAGVFLGSQWAELAEQCSMSLWGRIKRRRHVDGLQKCRTQLCFCQYEGSKLTRIGD